MKTTYLVEGVVCTPQAAQKLHYVRRRRRKNDMLHLRSRQVSDEDVRLQGHEKKWADEDHVPPPELYQSPSPKNGGFLAFN
jgi:hypothetical protein